MAKKTATSGTATPVNTSTQAAAMTAAPAPAPKKVANPQRWDEIALSVVNYYQKNTPQRTKLIDVFMAFLVVVGGLQFLYCIVAGNYVRFFFLHCRSP
jgi:oligosaccharyltransferase complex subunit epsilon